MVSVEMAQGVVDHFEVVEVDHQECGDRIFRRSEPRGDLRFKIGSVIEAGHGISLGGLFSPLNLNVLAAVVSYDHINGQHRYDDGDGYSRRAEGDHRVAHDDLARGHRMAGDHRIYRDDGAGLVFADGGDALVKHRHQQHFPPPSTREGQREPVRVVDHRSVEVFVFVVLEICSRDVGVDETDIRLTVSDGVDTLLLAVVPGDVFLTVIFLDVVLRE